MTDTQYPKIFCAIDTPDLDHAVDLSRRIAPITGGIKLGLEFFNAFGPQGIEAVLKGAPDAHLFIDLKFHDIPNTVAGAVRSICRNFSPMYLNVHAAGGENMMHAAVDSAAEMSGGKTKVLAVTILTSLLDSDLEHVGYENGAAITVQKMAKLAQKFGMAGVVCSAHEIEALRMACGDDFALMVPGIRPAGTDAGDQKRVMTPPEALSRGATHLVIGRPITQSDDPEKSAESIVRSLV